MQIYCEDTLLYGKEFFSTWGNIHFFSGNTVTQEDVENADLLLVRSTTKVTAELLHKAKNLKFVATATSGSEHLDTTFLKQAGIPYYAAGGCNAIAVAEYVISAIVTVLSSMDKTLQELTVGIVGAGFVGSALQQKLSAIGVKTLLCDPPLQEKGDSRSLVSLEEIMTADIISLHVPLVDDGPHATRNMFDLQRLQQLSSHQVLINACRGEVVSNQALLEIVQHSEHPKLVLDVWDNEPNIDFRLVPHVHLATPHIAGHTVEGKARGTEMVYHAAANLLGLSGDLRLADVLPKANLPVIECDSSVPFDANITALVKTVYDIGLDDQLFRATVKDAESFRYSRKNYAIRREFAAMQVNAGKTCYSEAIYELGFSAI